MNLALVTPELSRTFELSSISFSYPATPSQLRAHNAVCSSSVATMSLQVITACILGVSSHVFYFRIGEHHMSGPRIAILVPLVWMLIAALRLRDEPLSSAVRETTLLVGTYAASVYGSMTIYRLFFHPLRHFPGPVLARVSKFWHVFRLSGLQNQLLLEDLHQQYGDIVRIGMWNRTEFQC